MDLGLSGNGAVVMEKREEPVDRGARLSVQTL